MAFVVTLEDFTPGARLDGQPWTTARIEESAEQIGPWLAIDTQPLDPLDADPANPAMRSFTTTLATLADAWYRIAFIDALGNQQITEPVHRTTVVTPLWRPTVAQIAQVSPAYTRGGFDDDAPQAGAEQQTFTAATSPTAAHVEGLITTACGEVEGRVGVTIPAHCYGLAQTTARWHVAASISAGKIPAATDDATGEYRAHIANYRACLDALIERARQPTALRLV